ncbi:MAG: DUF3109 family protein [Ignavibacteria bacterium]|jgi:Fe-S-cluster containining protein|nr:DUF3109 family protein [Ignavibacteria bacterium]MCU7505124.1 DUF3109 family protein [Ignavibacteria bacterium]MCU7517501.1 DUF3109 family protein [Ignavibacteria bacterium]
MAEKPMRVIKGLKIDPLIFTQKFVNGCNIHNCSGECCYYGVYAESTEFEVIMGIKDRIIQSMDDSQTKDYTAWFEEPNEDPDFKSGIAVGTEVYNGKCVFLDKQGFCTLQKIAHENGENKWKYKPLYCILFPLVISDGVFTIDDGHLERMHFCNRKEVQTSTVFEVCTEEIIHVLGQDGYEELLKYRDEYFKELNK